MFPVRNQSMGVCMEFNLPCFAKSGVGRATTYIVAFATRCIRMAYPALSGIDPEGRLLGTCKYRGTTLWSHNLGPAGLLI